MRRSDSGTELVFMELHQALADTVVSARRAGVTLGVWTVNEPDALRRVLDLGVPIVITDRPDLAKGLLRR